MKRWWMSLLAACLVITACAGPVPTQKEPGGTAAPAPTAPSPADEQSGGAVTPGEPAPATDQPTSAVAPSGGVKIALTGEVKEWTGIYAMDKAPVFDVQNRSCQTDGTGLVAELLQAEWRPSPGFSGTFYAPTATFALCNAGNHPLLAQDVTVTFTQGQVTMRLPQLNPGDGVGPVRFYSGNIVPTGMITYWAEDGRRWPAWHVKLTAGTATLAQGELKRGIGDAQISVAPDPGMTLLPVAPGAEDLRRLAFSYEKIRYGSDTLDLFLYAPDVTYERSTIDNCSTSLGDLEVGGSQWAFWVGAQGGAPTEALLVGSKHFSGGRSVRVEPVPGQGITLLLLERYLSCANPMVYDIYAYDHRAGDVFRPQMKVQDGQVVDAGAARVEVLSDGRLVSRIYQNYGLIGTHTYVYRWEPGERMWVFESHGHTA